MAIQQKQEPDKPQVQVKKDKQVFLRKLIIVTAIVIALAIAIIWTLSSLGIIPSSWAAISSIIVATFGAVFTFLQSLHLFLPPNTHEPSVVSKPALQPPSPQVPQFIVQLPTNQFPLLRSTSTDKLPYRGIRGLPPPTDPRTIQQRTRVVKEIYTKLVQPGITALALTGIGGTGKSTLAALLYHYAEEQRSVQNGPFLAEALWLIIDPTVTFADLAGNVFEALGKPLPDLSNLAPQNQAVALFNALNATEKPLLVVLDQFENLLDWETGHALADRPGVGEWLDVINSHQCICRILLTCRPRPVGTREFPMTYLQEYPVKGLEVPEGVEFLHKQGVKGTEEELRDAVVSCAGHAFSLMLLVSLIRDHSINLSTLFKDPMLWIGDIATNLLDQIYTQRLSETQRELLLAFSVYRKPVPLDAAQMVVSRVPKIRLANALKALRTQHLLEAMGDSRYQLHAIIVEYTRSHFDETDAQANEKALQVAHAKAAQYYLQVAATACLPREQRQRISDVQPIVEAIWHYCHANQHQEAYNVMLKQKLFSDLRLWGGNAVLLELCQLLLPSNSWQPEHSQEAHIYDHLGSVYNVLGQNKRALEYFERALQLYKDMGDHTKEGWALNNLALTYGELGRREEASTYLKKALHIHREVGDRKGEAWALHGLAWPYRELGNKEEALKYYVQSLSIRREIGDRRGEAETLNCLGLVYADLGEKEQALKYYEQALCIRREVRDRGGEGRTLNSLGLVYADLGKNVQAWTYFRQSLYIRREIGDLGGEGITQYNIGKIYFEEKKFDVALACFLLAKSIFDEMQHPYRDGAQRWIERLQVKVGEQHFASLLLRTDPQAHQIVEKALNEDVA